MYLTPRTDALIEHYAKSGKPDYEYDDAIADHARQLERELGESSFAFSNRQVIIDTLKGDVNTLREQNAALKEFARHAPTCPMPAKDCDCGLSDVLSKA